MDDIYICVCGRKATELHHIVFRSQCMPLIKCKLNQIYLCPKCHRGTNGVHGSKGHYLDKKLKLNLQNKLKIQFDKEKLTVNDISRVLDIPTNDLNKLLKTLRTSEGQYNNEDIIRSCMGGKIII